MIDLFDEHFIEPQESAGMRILGQFRDLSKPDRFVWLRGFENMRTRAAAVAEFYGGPIWKAHRDRANETMIDSDNVFLLRTLPPLHRFRQPKSTRPPIGARTPQGWIAVAQIFDLDKPMNETVTKYFVDVVLPTMQDCDIEVRWTFQTEPSANTFPALPVRAEENTVVILSKFENLDQAMVRLRALDTHEKWKNAVLPMLAVLERSPSERLFLEPTARSLEW